MHLALRFLGPFQAALEGKTSLESRAKKIEALLAFLAVESETAHRRETLVGLLFPEMPDEQARINLRQTLARLRRAIHDSEARPPFLLITREATGFNKASNHTSDLRTFETGLLGCAQHAPQRAPDCAACMAGLAAAVAHYRGPFMDGFFLEDSAAFEEWLLATRERLQTAALTALQELAGYHETRGDYATAVPYLQQQLAIEPWRETAHRQLMRLLAYRGEREAALRQYQTLEKTLRLELGVAPTAKTKALRERIAAQQAPRPYRLPPANPLFVGRAEELALLHTYLVNSERRFITLFGSGGSGKTALAVEAAWQVATQHLGPFPDGVFFVPLASVAADQGGGAPGFDPLATAVAEAVGFSFSGAASPRRQLLHYLADKALLLLLDNMEHLLPGALDFVRDLLAQTSAPRILLTSRSRLGLAEEWIIDVPGLPYPVEDAVAPPEDILAAYPAVQLFSGQSRRLLPGFELGPGRSGEVPCADADAMRIVRLVQGLPLGIELAAGWVRLLDCGEIAAQIEKNLDFLKSTTQDKDDRHHSLRAVFDYSWDLLEAEEKRALRCLAIMRGPFDQAAATAVSSASLATLQNLIDRSWLRRFNEAGSERRISFEFLEVLRQFAAEKLQERPSEAGAAAACHAAHYMTLLAAQNDDLEGGAQLRALDILSRQIAEFRAAWRWAAEHGRNDLLAPAVRPLALFYYMRSWFSEGAELFSYAATLLHRPSDEPPGALWAQVAARQGWFLFLLGDQQEGRSLLAQSVATLRPEQSPDLAYALNFSAATASLMGDYETAAAQANEALTLTQAIDDKYGHVIAYNILSQIAFQRGDLAAARRFCESSLALEQLINNRWSSGFSLTNLGRVAFAQEDYEAARRFFEQSLVIRRSLADERGQAISLRYLGNTAAVLGSPVEASERYEASLRIFRRIGNQDETAGTLNSIGWLALHQGETTAAEEAFFAALAAAHAATAVPRALEALAGLAELLAGADAQRAARLAHIVAAHPAATFSSRDRAGTLLARLPTLAPAEAANLPAAAEDLDALIAGLIGEREPAPYGAGR